MLNNLKLTGRLANRITIFFVVIAVLVYLINVNEYKSFLRNLSNVVHHATYIENLHNLYVMKKEDENSGIMSFDMLNNSFWEEKYYLDIDTRFISISDYFSKEYIHLKSMANQVGASMSYLKDEEWKKSPEKRFSLKDIKDIHLKALSNLKSMSEKLIAANEKPDIWNYLTFILSIAAIRASISLTPEKEDAITKSI